MTQPPHFGGNPGEPVPEVDPDDLSAIWKFCEGSSAKATGVELLRQVCKPGADIEALGYRAGMLSLLTKIAPEQLEPWSKDGRLEGVALRAAARVHMEWMGVGIVRQGPPFDVNEFVRLCTELTGSGR